MSILGPSADRASARACKLARYLRAATLIMVLPGVAGAERLPARIFTTADGLPNNRVNRIVADSRGFLWFCTREGLARFDGHSFTTYGVDEGLPSGYVNDLLETHDGTYWVATDRGLVRFDPLGAPGPLRSDGERPIFTMYQPGESEVAPDTRALLDDRDGGIWVGTLSGLYRLGAGEARTARLERVDRIAAEVLSLAAHPSGELWVGTNSGVYRVLEDGRTDHLTTREGLPGNFINTLLSDREGRIWVGTSEGGLALVEREPRAATITVRAVFGVKDGLQSSSIRQVVQTADERILVVTPGGIGHVEPDPSGRSFEFRRAGSFRPTFEVLSAAEDRNHHLWIGTGGGAARILPGGFTVYAVEDGVPAASSLIETDRGELVAMTAGATVDGAVSYDGRRFVSIRLPVEPADVSWGWNQMMLVDRDGNWWIGTRRGALRIRGAMSAAGIHSAPKTTYSRRDGLASDIVIRLFEDSRGDVWIATVGEMAASGLSRWERTTGALRHYTTADGFPAFDVVYVCAFAEDRGGSLWMGLSGNGGLLRYRNGQVARFGAEAGIPPGTIRNLLVDARGRLWAASFRGGLLRTDAPASDRPVFSRYTVDQGLSSNVVGVVAEDRQGRIYAGTGRGIDRIDPVSQRVRSYRTGEGLPVGEFLTALTDRSGALWFGSLGGIAKLVPASDVAVVPPSVLINGLIVNGQSRRVSAIGQEDLGRLELPPGLSALRVEYVAPGFGPGDRVRYQTMLEGADADWSSPSDQRTVSYAHIGPGRYRFRVRAVSADGASSSTTAGFELRVLAPLWRRSWFLALAAALLGATAYGLHRDRLSRALEIADVRTRIATDLHDDIGANLTRIAVLSEVVRRQHRDLDGSADGRLSSIATAARESITAMSDIVWAVSPDRDGLAELARKMRDCAEEVFAPGDVRLGFSVADVANQPRLGVHARRDVYLIFKEAINNAARHSRCSRVDVELRSDGSHLLLSVTDDGAGFDTNGEVDGNGLVNMRRRAARLDALLGVASAPGGGTAVRLRMPLNRRRWTLPHRVGDRARRPG